MLDTIISNIRSMYCKILNRKITTDGDSYSEVSTVAHSKSQCNPYHFVIENKPQPQKRCYSKSEANSYTDYRKESYKHLNTHGVLTLNDSCQVTVTYAPREFCIRNLIKLPMLKLRPSTI